MVANSQSSQAMTPNGRRSTSKTSKLIQDRGTVLEILTQSLSMAEDAGIEIDVETEGDTVTIRLHGVRYSPTGVLVPADNQADYQACQPGEPGIE